jgi:putative transposase
VPRSASPCARPWGWPVRPSTGGGAVGRGAGGPATAAGAPAGLDAGRSRGGLGPAARKRFVDLPPAQVWAQVFDAGQVPPCSIRTMYRVLAANAEVRERRNQLRHPAYHKPELLATAPNQVWSWDITKLLGPVTWTYYYLYVLLDIFSRYVVGWLLARQESAALAKVLIAESCERQHIGPEQLTIHADRGPSMTSQPVALLLATLGVVPSHSRPHVSNDNPLLRGAVQDPQVSAGLPGPVRRLRGRRDVLPAVLPLVQHRARHGALGLLTPP